MSPPSHLLFHRTLCFLCVCSSWPFCALSSWCVFSSVSSGSTSPPQRQQPAAEPAAVNQSVPASGRQRARHCHLLGHQHGCCLSASAEEQWALVSQSGLDHDLLCLRRPASPRCGSSCVCRSRCSGRSLRYSGSHVYTWHRCYTHRYPHRFQKRLSGSHPRRFDTQWRGWWASRPVATRHGAQSSGVPAGFQTSTPLWFCCCSLGPGWVSGHRGWRCADNLRSIQDLFQGLVLVQVLVVVQAEAMWELSLSQAMAGLCPACLAACKCRETCEGGANIQMLHLLINQLINLIKPEQSIPQEHKQHKT